MKKNIKLGRKSGKFESMNFSTFSGSDFAQHLQQQTVGDLGPLAALLGKHVQLWRGKGEVCAEADELSGPLSDVRQSAALLAGVALSDGGFWGVAPERTVRHADRTDPSAPVPTGNHIEQFIFSFFYEADCVLFPGWRAHFLHHRADQAGDSRRPGLSQLGLHHPGVHV